MIHLDTHVVLWLWVRDSKRVKRLNIGGEALFFSPMVELELGLLHEIGRVADSPADIIGGLLESVGLQPWTADFGEIAAKAVELTWTRDPFDRLIVASAMVAKAPLLTADKHILEHYRRARAK